MAFNNAALNLAAAAVQTACVGAQLHSAPAGTNGTANVTAAGRQAITWAAPTGSGSFDIASALNFTGGAVNGPVYSVTLWSTSTTGGTFYGEFILAGNTTFNASGQYTVTSIAQTGAAS